MAGGFCSNPRCQILLTQDNCCPSAFKDGYGYCRDCYREDHKRRYDLNPEPAKEQSRIYQKKYRHRVRLFERSVEGRHKMLRKRLYKENVPKTDMLWSINFYRELIHDNTCHYCGLELNIYGAALDRMNNDLAHLCYNVVPCCKFCNARKMDDLSYEEMMLLAPILRQIILARKQKQI
jgi:hypothetical protein